MQTSQVKKGTANRKGHRRTRQTDENGHPVFKKPPLDRRIPGWRSAVWDYSIGAWVIPYRGQPR